MALPSPSQISAERRSFATVFLSFCNILICHSIMAVLCALAAFAHYWVVFQDPHDSNRSPLLLFPALIACLAIMVFTGGVAVVYPAFQYRRSFAPDSSISFPVIAIGAVCAASVALALFVSPLFASGYFATLCFVAASQARHEA